MDEALATELRRIDAMTIEARIEAALSMADRYAWVLPVAGDPHEEA